MFLNTPIILAGDDEKMPVTNRSIGITLDESTREVTVFGNPIVLPENATLITLAWMKDKPVQEQLRLLFTELEDYATREGLPFVRVLESVP